VFYLSVSPKYFAEAIQQLGAAGMLDDSLKTRLVMKTLWSRLRLSPDSTEWCSKFAKKSKFTGSTTIWAKTVQNILVFRFLAIFEPLWNRHWLTTCRLLWQRRWCRRTLATMKPLALRDMLQNHLMQLFSITAMEPQLAGCRQYPHRKMKVIQATWRMFRTWNALLCAVNIALGG